MRRILVPAMVATALFVLVGGTSGAQAHRGTQQAVPFAWMAEGQSHSPLARNRIEIARTREQVKSWDDEMRCYCSWGDFKEFSLVGVFYAGRSEVRVTQTIVSGSALKLSLAVSPTSSANGAFTVVGLPRRALLAVRTVTVEQVVEMPLAALPERPIPTNEPDVTIRQHVRPNAGRVFTAAYAQFAKPNAYLVTNVGCRASIGGSVSWFGDFKRLDGAQILPHPIVRKNYTSDGFVKSFSCSWRLPRHSAGKLFTLGENECYDDCTSGFMFGIALAAGAQAHGGYDTGWSGWSWRIAR